MLPVVWLGSPRLATDDQQVARAHRSRPENMPAEGEANRTVDTLPDAPEHGTGPGQSRLGHTDHYAPRQDPVEHDIHGVLSRADPHDAAEPGFLDEGRIGPDHRVGPEPAGLNLQQRQLGLEPVERRRADQADRYLVEMADLALGLDAHIRQPG